jgi:predicted metal-binding membrane protein
MAIAAQRVRPSVVERVPRWLTAAVLAAWTIAIVAWATGRGVALSHDALIHSNVPLGAALVASLAAWQVMFAAMMVPTAAPVMARLASGARPAAAMAGFLGAYALVWTAFGTAAFLGDAALHRTVHRVPWLQGHRWVVAGAVLAAAGAFQLTAAKRACLASCRDPERHVRSRERRGVRAGLAYGVACLGDCWALMLVMFAAGMANLWWMAALTALMAYEKLGRDGMRAATFGGATLLGLAGLVFLHPAWIAGLVSAG